MRGTNPTQPPSNHTRTQNKSWGLPCKTPVQFFRTVAGFWHSGVTLLLLGNGLQNSRRALKALWVEETEVYCSSADTHLPFVFLHLLVSRKSSMINILQMFS